jgi:hypothetical protein
MHHDCTFFSGFIILRVQEREMGVEEREREEDECKDRSTG